MSFYTPERKKWTGQYKKKTYEKKSKAMGSIDEFWRVLRENRTLHKGQEEILKAFFEDNYKYIFERIGRKGTKTATNIMVAWGYSILVPRSTCYITLPTITQAIEVYWDEKRLQWCDLPEPTLFDMFVKGVDNNKHIITFLNDSTIKLTGTWSEARGRGTQPNLLIADEIQDCSADYLDAMEPNLAAKEDARCVMTGTPPKKKNHYHEWEERIRNNPEGRVFQYSSYINTALPHLKGWLDNKKAELIKAGKEDVWLREYMAEDCFSSDERVLPDISLVDYDEMINLLRSSDPSAFQPIVGISITPQKMCATYTITLKSRYTGVKMWVLKTHTQARLWDRSYEDIYADMQKIMDEYSAIFPRPWLQIAYDETESFTDVIRNITNARQDLKWTKRGVPLLKEMILKGAIQFSTQADQFAVESQNLLKEDAITDYPTVCAMSVLANEYYQPQMLSVEEKKEWDRLEPLREAGIVCLPRKKQGRSWVTHNWD